MPRFRAQKGYARRVPEWLLMEGRVERGSKQSWRTNVLAGGDNLLIEKIGQICRLRLMVIQNGGLLITYTPVLVRGVMATAGALGLYAGAPIEYSAHTLRPRTGADKGELWRMLQDYRACAGTLYTSD